MNTYLGKEWFGDWLTIDAEHFVNDEEDPFIKGIVYAIKKRVINSIRDIECLEVEILEEQTVLRPEIKDDTHTFSPTIGWKGRLKIKVKQ